MKKWLRSPPWAATTVGSSEAIRTSTRRCSRCPRSVSGSLSLGGTDPDSDAARVRSKRSDVADDRAQLDPDRHPIGVLPRLAVPLGVAAYSLRDCGGVRADLRVALERRPTTPVDLAGRECG